MLPHDIMEIVFEDNKSYIISMLRFNNVTTPKKQLLKDYVMDSYQLPYDGFSMSISQVVDKISKDIILNHFSNKIREEGVAFVQQ